MLLSRLPRLTYQKCRCVWTNRGLWDCKWLAEAHQSNLVWLGRSDRTSGYHRMTIANAYTLHVYRPWSNLLRCSSAHESSLKLSAHWHSPKRCCEHVAICQVSGLVFGFEALATEGSLNWMVCRGKTDSYSQHFFAKIRNQTIRKSALPSNGAITLFAQFVQDGCKWFLPAIVDGAPDLYAMTQNLRHDASSRNPSIQVMFHQMEPLWAK